jgi:hypothetical protein
MALRSDIGSLRETPKEPVEWTAQPDTEMVLLNNMWDMIRHVEAWIDRIMAFIASTAQQLR